MRKPVARALLSIILTFYSVTPIFAQTSEWVDIDANCVNNEVATVIGFFCLLRNAITVIIPILGIALFIMLVMGGYKYLLSGGDPKAVEEAKTTFTMAIGGVITLLIGWAILYFLSDFIGMGSLLNLEIPDPS